MYINTETTMNALKDADLNSPDHKRNTHELATIMYGVGISPIAFAQYIAEYVMTERPTNTTPEQQAPPTPKIGSTINIKDVRPGMTVEIHYNGAHFYATAETVRTGDNTTSINEYPFGPSARATIIPRWTPTTRHSIN